MTQVETSDQALIQQILRGNHAAFKQLIEKHQKLVWHLIYRMVQHPEDSRELSQEVFLRVYNSLGSFRFESKLSTWIGRIAFNIASRHLQKKKLPLLHGDDDTAVLDTVADDTDLTAAVLSQQQTARLHQALAALAPIPRTILTLYYLDELSITDVADILQMPEGTVKNALFRARARLKAKLQLQLGSYDE